MKFRSQVIAAAALCLVLSGCSAPQTIGDALFGEEPALNAQTPAGSILRNLPAAKVKPVVAVYEFADQTGQHKPNDNVAEFSRAVTQGGATILTESLTKAGAGGWFTVIERAGLDHLLKERQIIASTRQQYGAGDVKLPPMLYAGVLLAGGIVSYDSNTTTGGLGAKYLGVGGSTEYRQDVVTVYLRAINVQNGEVLASVNTAKTIYSAALSANVFKFVAFDEILQIETGVTANEPTQLAVRQAIEGSVYALIMEGATKGLWEFADETAGRLEIQRYLARVNKEPLPEVASVAPQEVATPEPAVTAEDLELAPVVEETVALPRSLEEEAVVEEEAAPVEKTIEQVPATAEPKKMKKTKLKPESSELENGRYYQRLKDPKTNMYCTQSGCYPYAE